ncbi:Uncharacterized protein TCAP_05729 [Tolypocladium capitatum]|uniref:Aga1 a-agglutinin anchor subunit n=1 Tax=Tolypocladium capitatum TaxID=45235 RepID=A0A2K3Q9V5_9HYPO|nr:Uncharacterized protein TCAP_05729 [Tolypocladium capitatum]
MSSLQRTRSLRKPLALPSGRSALPSGQQARTASAEPSRNASPSRLPVKPPTRSASTATATAGVRGSRPVSAVLGRSASTSKRQNGTTGTGTGTATGTATATATAGQEPVKRETTSRYPPLSSANRPPPAAARPTSAGSATATRAKRGPTHARAKSTATSLNPATVLRPPSRDVAAPPRGRSASVDKAAPSTPVAAAPKQAQPQPQPPPRLRPAFSTLQQHYSPAKNAAPKPLTATFLAPPSPSKLPANVAASAETSKLQAELLQLHLLHREAAPVDAQWQDSARDKLGRRFARLGAESREVADRERAGVERENVLALRRWGSGGKGLEEKIQCLEDVFGGIWTLGETGGRYSRAVRRFERWMDHVRDVEDARRDTSPALLRDQDALFIGGLEAPWKDECAGITRRLEGWRAQLRDVDDQVPAGAEGESGGGGGGASLGRMLWGARSLVHDMLAELRLMGDMEREALAREEAWIESMNRDDEGDDTPGAGAVWRLA